MKLSIVSPVYKAEEIVNELVNRLVKSVSRVTDDFEIILVDDFSPDNSWTKIKEISQKDKRVKGIKLGNNFGQQSAITIGLENSKGDHVVVIDCDLQYDPTYIPELYKKAMEDYEIVYTRVKDRKHPLFRNLFSYLFIIVLSLLTRCNFIGKNMTSFSMLSRKVVGAFCQIKAPSQHYLLVLRQLDFKNCCIEITQNSRFSGKSSYSFLKLFKLAVDGILGTYFNQPPKPISKPLYTVDERVNI